METSNEAKDDSVYRMTSFEGKISAADFEQEITFVAYAGGDCRLTVDPMQVSGEAYVALSKCMGRPGSHADAITLTGESADGSKVSSTHMEIRGSRSGSEGHKIRLGTGEASITVPRKDTSKDSTIALKLSLRGFKSFRPNPVQARLGRVVVQGANKVLSSDDVSGAIFVEFGDEQPSDSWYHDAEALAEFVWKGLQFGHGGRLQVPLMEVYRPDEVIATF